MCRAHEVRSECQEKATADIVTERDRTQQLHARSALALGQREGRGHDGAAGMGFSHRLEVVGLIGVGEDAVDQCGVYGRGLNIGGDDSRFLDPALRPRVANRHFSGFEMGSRHHGGQRVQDAMPGFPRHVSQKTPLPRLHHISRQTTCNISRRHLNPLCLLAVLYNRPSLNHNLRSRLRGRVLRYGYVRLQNLLPRLPRLSARTVG